MAQLWGGRFSGEPSGKLWSFNASISFDIRLLEYDIQGSVAHAKMLGRQGILTQEESSAIVKGLEDIRATYAGQASCCNCTPQDCDVYEDVHSFVEAKLIEAIGDTGKKLHTGRSRNDQVALDMRLYTREHVQLTREGLARMLQTLHELMEQHLHTYMPGFTHLQKAQPVTLAHHLGAYFEMFKRDADRLADVFERMNVCPLGSGALAGTTYPLDREYVASLLGFDGVCDNSMDGVSDRDYLVEYLAALSLIQMHLSRFAEELILWNSDEYRFITLDDSFATGSSIMPQKKNPDVAELVRGKTGRVYGSLMGLLTVMKGLPLAYNKDMQEDKEQAFDAFDTVLNCLELFTDMLRVVTFHQNTMADSATGGFTDATDAADYLVAKGVPFRDAHGVIGRLVRHCLEEGCAIRSLSLEQLKTFAPEFEDDVYDAISLETCVEKRLTHGAPGPEAMKRVIAANKRYLDGLWQEINLFLQEDATERRKHE